MRGHLLYPYNTAIPTGLSLHTRRVRQRLRGAERSGEAWVITDPGYRRRGYGRQVTAGWAHALQQQGKVPFYSHAWDNVASQAVAQSLGLIQFMANVGYL